MTRLAHGFAVVLAVAATGVACDSRSDDGVAKTTAAPAAEAQPLNDAVITTTIQGRYFGSPVVKGYRIDVDTHGGIVTLSGAVDSQLHRDEAVRIAKSVRGVSQVHDRLAVDANARRVSDAEWRMPDAASPTWITTKIQAQYYAHPDLRPWNIDVDTAPGGVVTLGGKVGSPGDRDEAVRIAERTEGVTRIDDRISVQPETAATSGTLDRAAATISDGWMTSKIQSRYFVNDDVRGRNIDVDTTDGIVTLTGTVANQSERVHALAIARNTEGVRGVRDDLTVDQAMRRPPRAAGSAGSAGRRAGEQVNDVWITTKIKSKFFMVDELRQYGIDVESSAGVVTLSGRVSSAAAKEAAAQLARETAGVQRVVDKVRVDTRS
jgi:osmotically-inducible protein OsmY